MTMTLTRAQAEAEVATWSAQNPIHVGAGWHSEQYGGNALLRLMAAAGADVCPLVNEKAGHACFMVNGCLVDAYEGYGQYVKGMAECERVMGVDYSVLLALVDLSERFTRFDARKEVMDFVTDFPAGTEAVKAFVQAALLPLLPAAQAA